MRRRVERGDDTRERLLNAAIDVFGLHGFHGTTTRMLSQAAGVNQQAIPYHFEGKQGLYIAAAEHLGLTISTALAAPRQRLRERLARMDEAGGAIDEDEARRLLTGVLLAFAELLVGERSESWARFIVREQMAPTEAFDKVYAALMGPLLGLVVRLVGIILGEDSASEHVRLRTLSLVGSVLVFRVARAAALRLLEWDAVGARELQALRAHVADLVQAFGKGARR